MTPKKAILKSVLITALWVVAIHTAAAQERMSPLPSDWLRKIRFEQKCSQDFNIDQPCKFVYLVETAFSDIYCLTYDAETKSLLLSRQEGDTVHNKRKVRVKRFLLPIDEAYVDSLQSMVAAILHAASPDCRRGGFDGVSHYFYLPSDTYHVADTWSPDEESTCGRTVNLMKRLCAAVEHNDKHAVEQLRNEIIATTALFRNLPAVYHLLWDYQTVPQPTPLVVHRDTIVLDTNSQYAPSSYLKLDNAAVYDSLLYCLFRENRDYSNWGFDNNYFCVITPKTRAADWEHCQYQYDFSGTFVLTPKGIIFNNDDDTVCATYTNRRWHYQKQKAPHADADTLKIIYDDSLYQVARKNWGEWGNFTWITHKPTGKQLLYAYALDSPIRIGDTLFLKNNAGIWFVEPSLIARAKAGFCTIQKYHRKGQSWFFRKVHGGPRQQWVSTEERIAWYARATQRDYTDTLGSALRIHKYAQYSWQGNADTDTLIYALYNLNGRLAAVVSILGEMSVAAIRDGQIVPLSSIQHQHPFFSIKTGCTKEGLLLFGSDGRNASRIVSLRGNELHDITLIHDIDTLPWLEHDNFDTMLSFIHQHFDDITPDIIDRQETAHGSGSDRLQWDTLSTGNLFKPYFQPLINNWLVETVYWLDSTGRISTAWWDFHHRHHVDEFELQFIKTQQKERDQQLMAAITRILGQFPKEEDDRLIWILPEGTYTFNTSLSRFTFSHNEQP